MNITNKIEFLSVYERHHRHLIYIFISCTAVSFPNMLLIIECRFWTGDQPRICKRRGILLVILWLFLLITFYQTKSHTDIELVSSLSVIETKSRSQVTRWKKYLSFLQILATNPKFYESWWSTLKIKCLFGINYYYKKILFTSFTGFKFSKHFANSLAPKIYRSLKI